MPIRFGRISRTWTPKISASSRRRLLLASLIALGFGEIVEAQGVRVTGNVIRVVGDDSTALAARWVVLHAVGSAGGAAVDSQPTDRAGRYVIRVVSGDTSATYLTSVEHQGVGYFSEPFALPRSGAHAVPPLVVYDTSTTGAPIAIAERHVLVRRPDASGRRVIELFVLVNRERRTRVAADSASPVWQVAITPLASEFEIGLSDLGSDAIEYRDDTLAVFAPISPGERQILVGYLLALDVDAMAIAIDQPIDRLSVLLEDSLASLDAPSLTLRGVEDLDGTPLRRYGAESVGSGTPVVVRFGPESDQGPSVVWLLVPVAAVVLVGVFVLWWSRVKRSSATATADPAALAAEIAALDAVRDSMDEATYHARRAELKARLSDALAPPSAPH